jgi:hypothetical protein
MKKEMSSGGKVVRQPVTFVFNSRMLIPWERVKDCGSEEDYVEAIVIWQESHMVGHKYCQNEYVADVMNPGQRMAVRRIVYEAKENGRILGVECYWWMELTLEEVERQLKMVSERRQMRTVNKEKKETIKTDVI